MKVGLLVCDIIAADVASQFGQYYDRFKRLFENIESSLQLVEYKVCEGDWPNCIEECDCYIITGSAKSPNEQEPWIVELIRFIRECYVNQTKMIGICFGHQVIAKAMGGVVNFNRLGTILGIQEYEIVQPCSWMNPFCNQVNIITNHREYVEVLPGNATLIMTSEKCKIVGYHIKNLFLGIQGHPESNSFINAMTIERKRLQQSIDENEYQRAKASLIIDADQKIFAKWLHIFLNEK